MKILTREEARKLIGRLAMLRRFPQYEQGAISELVDAILVGAKEQIDEEIAKKVISNFIQDATSETECPMPRDIRSAVCSHLEEYRPDPDCPKCKGIGDIIGKYRDRNGGTFEAARRCDCHRRRPAPVWEKESAALPADHVPEEYREMLEAIKRAKGVVQ